MCQLKHYCKIINGCAALLLLFFSPLLSASTPLTLDQAERTALKGDPNIQASQLRALAAAQSAISSAQLADPKLSLGVFNVPIDDFSLKQNPSSQLRFGLSQTFAKGDSLRLQGLQAEYLALAQRHSSSLLQALLLRDVRQHFLETLYQQKALQILRKNRRYFAELLISSDNLYSVGRANQQAVLQAELELSRLDDQINQALNQLEIARASLAKWLPMAVETELLTSLPSLGQLAELPTLQQQLLQHPMIVRADAYIGAAKQGVRLAEEQYKPAVSLGLEYRQRFADEADGKEPVDMLAAMLSLDLPLFTDKRQDKRLAAQQYDYQALKWQRVDILRDMRQKLRAEYGNWQRLQQRSTRYQRQLLGQAAAHASAALSAYQSGVVNFSTLMYARISELDIRLRASRVEIDLLKAQAELLFYRVTVLPPQQGDKHAL